MPDTRLEMIRLASNIAWRTRGEEGDLTLQDLLPPDEYSDEEVARLWMVADEWRLAVNKMAQVIGAEWVKRWRDRGHNGIEVDGYLVTTKKGSTSNVCVDPEGFWEVVRDDPKVADYFNPNSVRVGQLPKAIRDTFFEKQRTMRPDAVRQATAIPVERLNTKESSNDNRQHNDG